MKHERLKSAIEKYTEVIKVQGRSDMFYAHFMGKSIRWFTQHPDHAKVICLNVRSLNDHDDSQEDYSAGCFFDTIKWAIKSFISNSNNGGK